MANPISNFEINHDVIKQEGLEFPVLRITYVARIFNHHADDYYHIHKYKIPVSQFNLSDYLKYKGNILKYMNNKIQMGKGIILGGYDPGVPPQFIDVTANIQKGAVYLLDQDTEPGYVYIYEFIYQYEGTQYSIVELGSEETVPFQTAADLLKSKRKCITPRNIRYRGQNPTNIYRSLFTEIAQDLKTWEENQDRLTTLLEDVILYDEALFQIYKLEDTIRYIIDQGAAYGYGVGKYGAKGGYGI